MKETSASGVVRAFDTCFDTCVDFVTLRPGVSLNLATHTAANVTDLRVDELRTEVGLAPYDGFLPPQQNLWAVSGSGSRPSV